MPTPDRFPGVREEEELKLLPESSDPATVGSIRLVSGDFRMRDNLGVFNPRKSFDENSIMVDDVTHQVMVDDVLHNVLVEG